MTEHSFHHLDSAFVVFGFVFKSLKKIKKNEEKYKHTQPCAANK
jgi:hypothetical protein